MESCSKQTVRLVVVMEEEVVEVIVVVVMVEEVVVEEVVEVELEMALVVSRHRAL